jgi:hypothetical protein
MGIVAVAALHRAFQDLMMEGHAKRRLHLAVTSQAKLGLTCFQHLQGREARLFSIRTSDEYVRAGEVLSRNASMRRVAFGATNVVAPMFAAAEVVVFLFARMTRQASLRDFFRWLVLE